MCDFLKKYLPLRIVVYLFGSSCMMRTSSIYTSVIYKNDYAPLLTIP